MVKVVANWAANWPLEILAEQLAGCAPPLLRIQRFQKATTAKRKEKEEEDKEEKEKEEKEEEENMKINIKNTITTKKLNTD